MKSKIQELEIYLIEKIIHYVTIDNLERARFLFDVLVFVTKHEKDTC